MKQTTKPKDTKQSQSLKRDLARNVAALPLPTPSAGAWGEGRFSFVEIQKTSNPEHRTSNFELGVIAGDNLQVAPALADLEFPQFAGIAIRRDEPLLLSFLITNPTNNEFQITKRMI